MKSRMNKTAGLLFISILIFMFTGSCSINGDFETVRAMVGDRIVTFETAGGSPVPSQTVANYQKAIQPDDPYKAGHTFGGWYREAACTNPWDFADAHITGNVTIYAKWIINEYTVRFYPRGGTPGPASPIKKFYGEKISKPAAISLTGNDFGGWYTSEEWTKAWDFDFDTIQGDTSLYAQWIGIGSYTVNFNADNGSPAPVQQIKYLNEKVTKPQEPTRGGYTFMGWFKEPELNNLWDFDNDKVSANIILYAGWGWTVSFNINGLVGTVPDTQVVKQNSEIFIPGKGDLTDIRGWGIRLYGWDTVSSGVGKRYYQGSLMRVEGNRILYAQWNSDPVMGFFGFDFIAIPAGSFQMGDHPISPKTPTHYVTLNGFSISKNEIWRTIFSSIMGYDPSVYISSSSQPVQNASWYEAIVFCNKLSLNFGYNPVYRINKSTNPGDWGAVPTASNAVWDAVEIVYHNSVIANGYRLPTEAEWEYAAKGGNGSPGNYVYSGSNTAGNVAWYSANSGSYPHEVGQKQANALGIFDMSGNVMEFCWDWSENYSSAPQTNPQGPSTGTLRIGRGGYFGSTLEQLYVVSRSVYTPYQKNAGVGIRLVRNP